MKSILFFSCLLSSVFGAVSPSFGPALTGNAEGNTVVLWSGYNGSNSVIQQSARAEGGSWASPLVLSSPGRDSTYPQVAMNASGELLYLWTMFNGSYYDVQVAAGLFGQMPPASATLSNKASSFAQVAIDSNGNGLAIWQEVTDSGNAVFAATYSTTTGWSVFPSKVSTPTNFFTSPCVAIHPSSGDAVAIWQEIDESGVISVKAATLPFLGVWSAPQTLSTPGLTATTPCIAYGSGGEAVGVWQIVNGQTTALQVSSLNEGIWSPLHLFALPDVNLLTPRLAVNASGEVLIGAKASQGTTSSIVTLQRDSFGIWNSFQTISGDDSNATLPMVQLNSQQQAIVVWKNGASQENGVIRSSRAVLPGSWTTPETISTPSLQNGCPTIALDEAGQAVAVWQVSANSQTQFQSSVLPSFNSSWQPVVPVQRR